MRTLLLLLFSLLLVTGAAAQTDLERAKKSDEILYKVKQLDLLNHILPVLITKEQMKKILPAVEKARQNVKMAQIKEFETLRKFETRINEAHKAALDNAAVPGRELLNDIINMYKAMNIYRQMIADDNTTLVIKAMEESLNAGQIKAATNALNPATFDPKLKPDQMTDKQKLEFFVKEIFLDPAAYDVLVELNRRMK